MKKNQLFVTLAIVGFISLFVLYACSKGGSSPTPPPNPCSGVTITVTATTTDADAGTSNGAIDASASGGTSFTFSINNGAFQNTGTFSSLAAGTYTITAKNTSGCTGSASITVNAKDACAGKTITVTPTVSQNADPCRNNGTVTVTATGGTGFTYNVDNGAFQASGDFTNLSSGNHTFAAKEAGGCAKTSTISVPAATAGPKFTDVKAIIQVNCAIAACHGGTQAPNFTVDCNIVAFGDLIKFRAVDQAGTPNQMPQPPRAALTQAERDKITLWFNAGFHYTD
jgi:hypothetical protein